MKIARPQESSEAVRDHVDFVRAQWAQERPDLDTGPVAVVARMGRAARVLDQGVAEGLAHFGLTRESWDVLASLRRTGTPYQLSPTVLYRSLMRTSGAMTNRIGRLEQVGLVRRASDPDDGRMLLVVLTPKGRKLVDQVAEAHIQTERQLIAALTTDEQEVLAALLRKLLLSLEIGIGTDQRGHRSPGGFPAATPERPHR